MANPLTETALLSDKTGREYIRLTKSLLGRYRTLRGYDDLVGFCLWFVCRQLMRLEPEDRETATGWVAQAVKWAAWQWLRSPENPDRRYGECGNPVPVVVSLGTYMKGDDDRESPLSRWVLHQGQVEPDFAPALIHRLWCEEVWEEALSLMDEQEERACRLMAREEASWRERAKALGVSRITPYRQAQRGMNRYRRLHDLPLVPDGTNAFETPEERLKRQAYQRARPRKKEKR